MKVYCLQEAIYQVEVTEKIGYVVKAKSEKEAIKIAKQHYKNRNKILFIRDKNKKDHKTNKKFV